VSVGALIGALALPAIARYGGYRAAFDLSAVLVALPSVAAYALYRESPDEQAGGDASFGSILRGMLILARDPRLIAVTLTCMALSATQFIVGAFLTITAVEVVRAPAGVAELALAVVFTFAICGRLGWGFVSDRYWGGDRLIPLGIICGLSGVAAGILALISADAIGPLVIASALMGLSAAGWNGLMAAALSEIGGPARAASALELGLTGIFAASALAPWLFGLLADSWSLRFAWGWVVLLCGIGLAPVLWLRAYLAAPSPAT
jgi:MFS family permease